MYFIISYCKKKELSRNYQKFIEGFECQIKFPIYNYVPGALCQPVMQLKHSGYETDKFFKNPYCRKGGEQRDVECNTWKLHRKNNSVLRQKSFHWMIFNHNALSTPTPTPPPNNKKSEQSHSTLYTKHYPAQNRDVPSGNQQPQAIHWRKENHKSYQLH